MPYILPPFCRQGNKYSMLDDILPLIPSHKVYVELFVGSGAVFYNKEKAEKNIINDLDKTTINNFRLIKNAPLDPDKYYQPETIEETKKFFRKHGDSVADKIVGQRIELCTGFRNKPVKKEAGIYRHVGMKKFLKNVDVFKEKMKDTIIENKDYGEVVKKYDGVDTFFFIDPPYENTRKDFGYAQTTDFDFERLKNILSSIKGKFLLTINDSDYTRNLFKDFYIKPIDVFDPHKNIYGSGKRFRKELIITNYKVGKMEGSGLDSCITTYLRKRYM